MTLTNIERRWAHAVFEAIFPRGKGVVKVGVLDLDLDGYLDGLSHQWPALAWGTFRVSLLLVVLASVIFLKTLRSYSKISLEKRISVLERLYKSEIYYFRSVVVFLKATAGMLYGAGIREVIAPGRAPSPVALIQLRSGKAR